MTKTPNITFKKRDASFEPSLSSENLYEVTDNHETSDFLFTEAQSQMIEGMEFEKTRLYTVVIELYKAGASLYFWYGSDSADLPVYTNIETLLEDLQTAVKTSACEFYGKIETEK